MAGEFGWQPRVDRLDEVTLVQARILERLENKYDEAIQRHDEEIAELRSVLLKLLPAVDKLTTDVQVMKGGMDSLFERIDRFIRGQEGNGHKQ